MKRRVAVLAVIVAVFVGITALQSQRDRQSRRDHTHAYASLIDEDVWNLDRSRLATKLPQLLMLENNVSATILHADGTPLFEANNPRHRSSGATRLLRGYGLVPNRNTFAPIKRNNNVIAYLQISTWDRSIVFQLYMAVIFTILAAAAMLYLDRVDQQRKLAVQNVRLNREISERLEVETALRESEERFRSLLENVPHGVLLLSPEMKILKTNHQLRTWFPEVGNIEDAFCFKCLGKTDAPCGACPVVRSLADGEVHDAIISYPGEHEGSKFRIIASPVRNDEGDIFAATAILEDVTERLRMEERMRAADRLEAEMEIARFKDILDNATELVAVISPDGHLRYLNLAGRRMLQWDEHGDLTGRKAVEFHAEETSEYIRHVGVPYAREHGAWCNETVFLAEDGKEIPTLQVLIAHYDADGEVDYYSTIATDVTQLKQAEQKIRVLNEDLERRVQERTAELQAVNRELEAFCYSISHDLRTPLRGIDGFSLALIEDYEDQLDDTGSDYLRRVRGAALRMSALIDDLLALSRLSRKDMHLEPVDLSKLVKEILSDLREAEPGRNIEVDIQPGIHVDEADAALLRSVLENLLTNAIKFTRNRDPSRIEFGAKRINNELVCFVRDNGVGFDMDFADKLFKPFQRLHANSDFEGSGIGLASVQRVIHRHGGRIWVDSAVDSGATFYFTLHTLHGTTEDKD